MTPGALARQFTDAFGPPAINRDTGLTGSISYIWLILDGVFVRLEEPVGPGAAGTFSVMFVRFYGSPTTLPTAAEGAAWMDVTRVFGQDEIDYHWQTQHGTTVDLLEGLKGDWRHWLRLRAMKPEK